MKEIFKRDMKREVGGGSENGKLRLKSQLKSDKKNASL